jgi:hypothetical protein
MALFPQIAARVVKRAQNSALQIMAAQLGEMVVQAHQRNDPSASYTCEEVMGSIRQDFRGRTMG